MAAHKNTVHRGAGVGSTRQEGTENAGPRAPSRATEEEVAATIREGERFPAKFGRTGFRRNFAFGGEWLGRRYATKQLQAYAVEEDGWLVITVIVRYF